jgi:Caspase domain/WD domain, G-beta repeat
MPLGPDPPPGPRLALVVATGTYTDPGLSRLRAPARDADDLAQILADPGIGGFAVTTVIDQPAHQVRLAIEEFLNGRSTGDLLLVYLSCHGLLDARRRLYFAATDTRKDLLGSTGVEAAWVLDQLEHCRARRQVLILDSCFSGAFAHGTKGEAELGLQDRFLGQGRGRVVLTASTATEYSFEGDPTDTATPAGSVFTAALVQGLRTGAADTDHDGHVSVDDAYAYVFDQVQAAGAAQTPQRWLYGAEGQILLAWNPAGPTIIPAPLPESLRAGLDNPRPGIRVGAVTELGGWLTGGDPARAATARRHLQEVADTDIPRVAHTARTLLDAGITAEPPTPDRQAREDADRQARAAAAAELERIREKQARKARENAERQARENAERQAEASRRRDIAELQDRLRTMFAAGEFQAVVGIADRLAELDLAAADPDGLTTQARRRLEQQTDYVASPRSTPAADLGPEPVYKPEPVSGPLPAAAIAKPSSPDPATAAEPSRTEPTGPTRRELTGRPPRPQCRINCGESVNAVSWHPDGRRIAVATKGPWACVYDVSGKEPKQQLRVEGAQAPPVRVNERRTWRAKIFGSDRADSEIPVYDVAFSPDGTRLATICISSGVRVWDAASGQRLLELGDVRGTAVAFSPDGTRLAVGGFGAGVWDAASGQRLLELGRGDELRIVGAVAFSPDGTRLAVGGSGAGVWDAASGQRLLELGRGDELRIVKAMAFSSDGTRLAAGGYTRLAIGGFGVWVWDAASGQRLLALGDGVGLGLVEAVAFSPDGTRLAAGGNDNSVQIWLVAGL